MFQLFKRDLTIVVLVFKKLLGVILYKHITKATLFFCYVLINYESVKFSLKFPLSFLKGFKNLAKLKSISVQFCLIRFG